LSRKGKVITRNIRVTAIKTCDLLAFVAVLSSYKAISISMPHFYLVIIL
jgi:hypothetical protein